MIIYTKHFLERIKQRNINLPDIKNVLEDKSLLPINDTLGNYIKQKKVDGYLLRVIYRVEKEDIIVISSNKTSKIEKYDK